MKQRLFFLCLLFMLPVVSASAQKKEDFVLPPPPDEPALTTTPRAWLIDYQINDSFAGFEVLDSAARYGRFFLGGEDHRFMDFNSSMELKLMRYLHARGGVRHMILELGFARGYVLQQYINTGDSVWLDILDNTTGSDYMEMYRAMREWNRQLPDSAKVIVTGIDVERYTDVPLLLLEQLLPDSGIPEPLLVGVEAMKGLARQIYVGEGEVPFSDDLEDEGYNQELDDVSSENYEVRPTIRRFLSEYDSLKPLYRSYLGKHFATVDVLLNSLKQYLQWDDYEYTPYQYTYREKVMYDNMKALLQRDPQGKFYGQFGRCHAGTDVQNGPCGWMNFHSISQKMASLMPEPFRNQVVTIGYFYAGDEEDDDDESKSTQEQEISAFAAETPEGRVALFSLDQQKQAFPVLTSRYDFVLFFNDAESSFDDDEYYEDYDDEYDYEFTHFGYVYHREWGKTSQLNTTLQALGLPSVPVVPVLQGFDISYFPRKYSEEAGGRLSVLWMPTQTQRFGAQADSLMRFNMFRVFTESIFDILESGKFNLAIGSGLGYGLSRIELKKDAQVVDFRNPQPNTRILYRNPALWISLGAHARAAFGPISIGISGGIAHDFSKSAWRYKGNRLEGTPSFAQHMKYLEATVGFVIKE